MKLGRIFGHAFALLLVCTQICQAQDTSVQEVVVSADFKDIAQVSTFLNDNCGTERPANAGKGMPQFDSDPSKPSCLEIRKQIISALSAHFYSLEKETWTNSKRTETILNTQEVVSWIGLVLSHFLVLVGLIYSAIEFRRSWTLRALAEKEHSKSEKTAETVEINLSVTGISVKSALNGILALGISMAFYVLYLKFIYPVHEIGGA